MILGLLVEQSINSGLSFWISNDVSGHKQNGTFAPTYIVWHSNQPKRVNKEHKFTAFDADEKNATESLEYRFCSFHKCTNVKRNIEIFIFPLLTHNNNLRHTKQNDNAFRWTRIILICTQLAVHCANEIEPSFWRINKANAIFFLRAASLLSYRAMARTHPNRRVIAICVNNIMVRVDWGNDRYSECGMHTRLVGHCSVEMRIIRITTSPVMVASNICCRRVRVAEWTVYRLPEAFNS